MSNKSSRPYIGNEILFDGAHRLYLSLAIGYTHVPAVLTQIPALGHNAP